MIITVAGNKGGIGKTTTAVHLAAYFGEADRTVLIDSDPNRSALGWKSRDEEGMLPFSVVDEHQIARASRQAEHLIIDTQARADDADLKSLASGCDLLILPTTPETMALEQVMATAVQLEKFGATYRVLFTIVPPPPEADIVDARVLLKGNGIPAFDGEVRRAKVFQKAALAGCPVHKVKERAAARAWSDYIAIGREVEALQR